MIETYNNIIIKVGKQQLLHHEYGIKYYCCSECGSYDCKAKYCRNCGAKFNCKDDIPKAKSCSDCTYSDIAAYDFPCNECKSYSLKEVKR